LETTPSASVRPNSNFIIRGLPLEFHQKCLGFAARNNRKKGIAYLQNDYRSWISKFILKYYEYGSAPKGLNQPGPDLNSFELTGFNVQFEQLDPMNSILSTLEILFHR
jgi:hypothetical protein